MYPANITRAEAAQRSAALRTSAYRVGIDLSGRAPDGTPLASPEATFVSTSSIDLDSSACDTHLDLLAEAVLTATLDGEPLDVSGFTGERLPLHLGEGAHVLTVTALCRYSNTGEGLHRFVDPADDRVYLYTQLEVADARRVYACFEQPDLKASFEFSVTAPEAWTVLSNSPAVAPVPLEDGFARWDFAATPPISTYITALIAGEYHTVHSSHEGWATTIPLSISCRQSMVEALDADRIFDTTKRGFDVFEEKFGMPYPFADYAQIFVPEFNAGAMENAGCVTLRDEYLFRSRVTQASFEARDNTILHELAHMWFGDLVTMTWWDDLWLNESFAEWASHFAQDEIRKVTGVGDDPWVTFCNQRKLWAYRQDQLPSTHPVAADMVDLEAVELNFDGITYAKGASVLQQLVAFVGLEEFLAGIRRYFAEHAWGNTRLSDLLGALEASSGRDLSRYTADWLQTAGVNTLRTEYEVDDDGRFTRFAIRQTTPAGWPTLRRQRIGLGLYDWVDDRLVRTRRLELDIDGELTDVPLLVGQPVPAFALPNDCDLGYAKIRINLGLDQMIAGFDRLDDQLARALCWAAAWDMCRDAELPSADHVELVMRGVSTEADLTAVTQVLAQAQLDVDRYCAPGARAALGARQTAGIARLLKEAPPSSDHQLSFARALATAVRTPAGAEVLAAWLNGGEVPEGLTIDDDLRWRLVINLARLGAIGEDEIAAAEARDKTSSGEEHAAAARAARPDPAAKEAAWLRATADPSVPNETHYQICANFWQVGQADDLRAYADRYLDVVRAVSDQRDGWGQRSQVIRKHVLELLFPWPLADREFLDRLDGWLAATPLTDSVRRVLNERRDDAERALRCQLANPA